MTSLTRVISGVLGLSLLAACSPQTGPTDKFCSDFENFRTGDYYAKITDVTDLSQVLAAQDSLVKAAKQILPPDEIASSWDLVAKTTEDHAVAMRGIDWSDKQALADYLDYMENYNSPELDKATADVQAFVTKNCSSS